MIEDGAMQDVDAVFGLHIGAHLEAGKAFVRAGPYMAGSDTFMATVRGKSAHAARPQEGIDAIVLAAHAILACQNAVSRRISPMSPGVLTIGRIAGGVAENIIADCVTLQGTIRYFDEDVRIALHHALTSALGVVDALGGHGQVQVRVGYPPVVNDEAMTRVACNAAESVLGRDGIAEYEPMMGAEDFAYLQREAPGCFFWLGAALNPPREHHHPDFDIDEQVLPKGAALLAGCALERMSGNGKK
jgi:amidohydrolase